MCFRNPPKPPKPPPPPAAAPAAPEAAPKVQEVGSARKAENEALYGNPTGPKLRRSNKSGAAAPTGPTGIRM